MADAENENTTDLPPIFKKYCGIRCGSINHTLCSNHIPPRGPPSVCASFIFGLTEEEKDSLLELHNEIRRQVAVGEVRGQPVASDMIKLTWDDEVALIAQRWADQCSTEVHDLCRITLAREPIGQNLRLAHAGSRTNAMKASIDLWFAQHDYFNSKLVDRYDTGSDSAKSYCNLVWAKTTRVGCGFAAREVESDKQYKIVCNYAPAGALHGQEVYMKGKPCTNCPTGYFCSASTPGLCTDNRNDLNLHGSALTLAISSYLFPMICIFLNLRLL